MKLFFAAALLVLALLSLVASAICRSGRDPAPDEFVQPVQWLTRRDDRGRSIRYDLLADRRTGGRTGGPSSCNEVAG